MIIEFPSGPKFGFSGILSRPKFLVLLWACPQGFSRFFPIRKGKGPAQIKGLNIAPPCIPRDLSNLWGSHFWESDQELLSRGYRFSRPVWLTPRQEFLPQITFPLARALLLED